jgi:hypothetical protein
MPYTEEEELWLRHELELLVAVSSNFSSSSLTLLIDEYLMIATSFKGGDFSFSRAECLLDNLTPSPSLHSGKIG